MTAPDRDRVREVLERALDESTVQASQAGADIFRSIARGTAWSSPILRTVVDRFGRASRDQAIAKALLRELDAKGGA